MLDFPTNMVRQVKDLSGVEEVHRDEVTFLLGTGLRRGPDARRTPSLYYTPMRMQPILPRLVRQLNQVRGNGHSD